MVGVSVNLLRTIHVQRVDLQLPVKTLIKNPNIFLCTAVNAAIVNKPNFFFFVFENEVLGGEWSIKGTTLDDGPAGFTSFEELKVIE